MKVDTKKAARQIVDYFIQNVKPQTIQYDDYNLKEGKMQVSSKKANTYYKFNTQQNTQLRNIIDIIIASDQSVTEQTVKNIEIQISNNINCILKKEKQIIRKKIISSIFGIKTEQEMQLFPCQTLTCHSIQLNTSYNRDLQGGYVLVVQKIANKGSSESGIAAELINIQGQTGKSYQSIIKQKKQEQSEKQYQSALEAQKQGNQEFYFPLRWRYVIGATKKYYQSQIYFNLCVDYSLAKLQVK